MFADARCCQCHLVAYPIDADRRTCGVDRNPIGVLHWLHHVQKFEAIAGVERVPVQYIGAPDIGGLKKGGAMSQRVGGESPVDDTPQALTSSDGAMSPQ